MREDEKEKQKRRERLKIFANQNQWMKKKDLEQTLEDMSAQLREYRRDLQQLRIQEAATEAKIDRLQQQVNSIEQSLRLNKNAEEKPETVNKKVINLYEQFDSEREGYSAAYCENGVEIEDQRSTVSLFA